METKPQKSTTENFVKDIRRKTRRLFTSEQKTDKLYETVPIRKTGNHPARGSLSRGCKPDPKRIGHI